MAMGASLRAAALALRHQGAARVVAAVPVAWRSSCEELRPDVDELVTVAAPEPFHTVSRWYHDFAPTTDDEVCALLGVATPVAAIEQAEKAGEDSGLALAVSIPAGAAKIRADLVVPKGSESIVVFAHTIWSSPTPTSPICPASS